MLDETAYPLKIRIVTTEREDLFDLSRLLARGLNDNKLLSELRYPVNVYVDGSYGSGKKIFPDAVREEMLGADNSCRFAGKPEYDEYWTNAAGTREVDFINTAWGEGKFSDVVYNGRFPAHLMEAFQRARGRGGVNFIHNLEMRSNIHRAQMQDSDGLHIYMEKVGHYNVWNESRAAHTSDIKMAFETAVRNYQHGLNASAIWNRYVEIVVFDDRLLQSKGFMDAAAELSRAAKEVAADLANTDNSVKLQPLAKYLRSSPVAGAVV